MPNARDENKGDGTIGEDKGEAGGKSNEVKGKKGGQEKEGGRGTKEANTPHSSTTSTQSNSSVPW